MADTPDQSDDESTWEDLVDESAPAEGEDGDTHVPDGIATDVAEGDLDDGTTPGSDGAPAVDPADPDAMVVEEEPDLPPPEESVLADVVAYFEGYDGEFAPAPSESFVREEFFDLSYREGAREVERYWVSEPYAFVSVLHDETENDYRYHVVEPTLSEFERYVREDVSEDLRDVLLHVDPEEGDREELLDRELRNLADRYALRADPGSLHKIRYYIRRDLLGYDRIDPLLADRRLEDISCDGVDVPVFVYHRDYRDLETNVAFPEEPLNSFVICLVERKTATVSVS